MKKHTHALLTFDMDWAPNYIIERIVNKLIELNIPSIWFVTNQCKALALMRKHQHLFELGIHPNFHPNSTQGTGFLEVMKYLMKIVPEARSMRTHGLMTSSAWLLQASSKFNIKYDFSCFLPYTTSIVPHNFKYQDSQIKRIPYNWEDDVEVFAQNPFTYKFSKFKHLVLDFHPIHICLNTYTFDNYIALLSLGKNLQELNKSEVEKFREKGKLGTSVFFENICCSKRLKFCNIDTYLQSFK